MGGGELADVVALARHTMKSTAVARQSFAGLLCCWPRVRMVAWLTGIDIEHSCPEVYPPTF